MAGSLYARARFMVGLVLRVASRALPSRPAPAKPGPKNFDDEALIEALMTCDLDQLTAHRQRLLHDKTTTGTPWFFIALESGGLSTVTWFLDQGANPAAPAPSGRLPLEAVIQRAALADEFDDHLSDCAEIARALIARGADLSARTIQGDSLSDLAAAAELTLA